MDVSGPVGAVHPVSPGAAAPGGRVGELGGESVEQGALDLAPGARRRLAAWKKYLLAGEFGAAARLSPKALRLYAEQGLLPPASVDPATGYRYYAPDQLPRARLIGRLRRLGLPLARIGLLADLTPDARALELRGWLRSQRESARRPAAVIEAVQWLRRRHRARRRGGVAGGAGDEGALPQPPASTPSPCRTSSARPSATSARICGPRGVGATARGSCTSRNW